MPEATTAAGAPSPVQAKFVSVRAELAASLIEREDEIDAALAALVARESLLLVGPPGCLAGDTEVRITRAGNGTRVRLDTLVSRFNGAPYRGQSDTKSVQIKGKRYHAQVYHEGRFHQAGTHATLEKAKVAHAAVSQALGVMPTTWDPAISTYVPRNVDGVVRRGRLKAAWCSGVKPTFTLTTASGKSIRATEEHPFLDPSGVWRPLRDLRPGDAVLTEAAPTGGGPRKLYRNRCTRFHPCQRPSKRGYRYVEHRLAYEARMNGLSLADFLQILRCDSKTSAGLKYLTPDQVVHHVDGNHLNNDPSNLEAMTQAEHNREHGTAANGLTKMRPDVIVSIVEYGDEATYDLEMEDDPHSFIANGFAVHNCGKSLLSNAIVRWMDGRSFSALLTKFTVPEELFGPISINGLRNDEYRRIVTGKLPEAEVVYLDEIWKASSAILNTLLTALNERVYDNGGTLLKLPLRLCVASSNEWPSHESGKEQAALLDRFLVRRTVRPISTPAGRSRLLWGGNHVPSLSTTITPEEVDAAAEESRLLPWTPEAVECLEAILRTLKAEGVCPGDRRQYKSVGVARAAAYLDGAASVLPAHLGILADVLWDDPDEQPAKAMQVVTKIANPVAAHVNTLLAEAEDVLDSTDARDLGQATAGAKKLREVIDRLTQWGTSPRVTRAVAHVEDRLKALKLAMLSNVSL